MNSSRQYFHDYDGFCARINVVQRCCIVQRFSIQLCISSIVMVEMQTESLKYEWLERAIDPFCSSMNRNSTQLVELHLIHCK